MQILAFTALLLYIFGIMSAAHAVMHTRTSQGAIAWALSLLFFPFVAVPAYWVFGRRKFKGYILASKTNSDDTHSLFKELNEKISPYVSNYGLTNPHVHAAEQLAQVGLVHGNECKLLIDGVVTFNSIFTGIDAATQYVLVQFYIVNDDNLGRALKSKLIAKAQEGIKVYFLYDELGSFGLPASYIEELEREGVCISAFNTRKGKHNRFQLNFRNHRKVVIVDGTTTWIGGHNVGDAYLGRDQKIGKWRDTHVRIIGPAALLAQVSFIEDYYWATNILPEVKWEPTPSKKGNIPVLIIPSGPADEFETATLMNLHIINSAQQRIWISTPYFVPDESINSALTLARLRGVDVRIIIPEMPDNKLMYFAAFNYFDRLSSCGIEFYRYHDGFTHEKVMLIDDALSAVGTANFDNRSFRLNFEITSLIGDRMFAQEVEHMFNIGFSNSNKMQISDYDRKPLWFKFAVKVSRLLSPIL